ncbi:MAG: nucleoside/nucleotide kinase family protein [Eubacterium sp.]|nr:nucleoside/nucleotide kinase family protein [Eubacterium sp.]
MEHRVMINGIEVAARYSERAVNGIFIPFLKKLTEMQQAAGRRILVMMAAPPGAGKSTLLSFLDRLAEETEGVSRIQTIGMDGFHRRQEYLLSHDTLRDGKPVRMVDVKGAPETFDLEALTERVKRVSSGETVGWPVYDRLLHNPVEDAVSVDGEIVILEGNYLLLDLDGWRELKGFADYTVSVRAEETLLRERLISRRIKTGVAEDEAARFVDYSDMPNVRLCLSRSVSADLQLEIDETGEYREI